MTYSLPKLPENQRWRLTEDSAGAKLLLEEKSKWFGWRRLGSSYIVSEIWGDVDRGITWAGNRIMDELRTKEKAKNRLGVLDA